MGVALGLVFQYIPIINDLTFQLDELAERKMSLVNEQSRVGEFVQDAKRMREDQYTTVQFRDYDQMLSVLDGDGVIRDSQEDFRTSTLNNNAAVVSAYNITMPGPAGAAIPNPNAVEVRPGIAGRPMNPRNQIRRGSNYAKIRANDVVLVNMSAPAPNGHRTPTLGMAGNNKLIDGNGRELGLGQANVNKETALAYFREVKRILKDIETKMEILVNRLNVARSFFEKMKEQFQQYAAKDIDNFAKNKYMGQG